MKSDPAISETISAILIILMVLMLVIVVTGLILGANIFQQKSALIASDIKNQTLYSKNFITVFHRAGEEVYLNSSLTGLHEMGIYLDNKTNSSRARPVLGLNAVKPGTTLFIYYNTSKNIYRITTNTATLSTNEAQSVTDCPMKIRLVDEKSHLILSTWDWTCTPLPLTGPAPTITSSTPATGVQSATVGITRLAGTNFLTGATVTYWQGATIIPLQNINVVSSTNITGTLSVPSGAPVGAYNITVTNPDGKSVTRTTAGTFTVTSNAPTVTGITPNTANLGWPVNITNLAGTRFQPGAVVKLVNSSAGADIMATSIVVNPANTSITCTFDLTGAPAARRNVTVTNPDGKNGTLANGFTVTSNAPTITGSTPATGAQAATIVITRLAGTNFQPGTTVTYWQGATIIPLQNINVVSSTNITGTLSVPAGAPVGAYNITVTNPDGKSVTRTTAGTFTVTSNAPTVTSITPNTYVRGWTVTITNLAGTRFQTGATVKLVNATAGPDIIATSVVVNPANTSITCSFDLTGAPAARRNVTIINPDGKSVTLANGFTVTSTAPTISSITPNTAARGTTVSITNLAGANFQPGATVELRNATTVISTGASVNIAAPNQLTCQFTIPSGGVRTGTNAYYIRVTNTDTPFGNSGNIFSIT